MAELLRCKSCGYVAEAGKVGEVCPACGVARRMMEPWKDPVSPSRRQILWLDLHPIMDHFTISFAASAFVLSLVILVLPSLYERTVTDIIRGFAGVLPFAVIASFLTGLLDARVRFRRTTAPMLGQKKLLGLSLFLASGAAAALVFAVGPYVPWVRVVDAVLLAAAVTVAVRLGRLGQGLLQAIFPG